MATVSGAAKVIPSEQDLSTRVGIAIGGAVAIMVLVAPRGPLTPQLVGSATDLFRKYTPNGTVQLGYDDSFFQALSYLNYSNKLYVVRAQNQAKYGGYCLPGASGTTFTAAPIEFGFTDPALYDVTTTDGRADLGAMNFTADATADTITVPDSAYALWKTADPVTVAPVSTGTLPAGLSTGTTYYLIKTNAQGKFQLAIDAAKANAGTPAIDITSAGTGTMLITNTGITTRAGGAQKALVIYGADPGAWNNNIRIRTTTDPLLVKEPNAFLLEVFNGTTRVESWTVSRDPNAKDLRNQSLYIETVLKASSYVRAVSNPLVDPSILPAATGSTPIALAGASDGLAVTDGVMAQTLQLLSDSTKFPAQIVFDSGWTTPDYQQAIINFAEARGDVGFILSAPYECEVDEDYLNRVISYKQDVLASNSNYGGIFSPHVQVFDDQNNRDLWIAPSGDVAGRYSQVIAALNAWQPVAGNTQGVLLVRDVMRNYSAVEQDALYDANINPIRLKSGKGVTIWGQKTLQTRVSDLDRMNARFTLLAIKPPMTALLEEFLFSLNNLSNNTGTRGQIYAVLFNYLSSIKSKGGLYDFKIVCDNTNNSDQDVENRTLNVWVFVKIVEAIEYIPFIIGVTAEGTSFTLAESLITA